MRRSLLFHRLLLVDTESHRVAPEATVALVTWNSPTSRNALTVALGDTFKEEMSRLRSLRDLRAIVLTGSGAAFSAGGDAKFLAERLTDTKEGNYNAMRGFYSRFLSLRDVGVPVIAAVNGHAIGAGMCIALACDMRIVNEAAKLSVNFVKLGIHPGMGASYFLPQICGHGVASRLLLTGEPITGAYAMKVGIASEALAEADVLPRAIAVAKDLAGACSALAVREMVKTLRENDADGLEAALRREATAQAECYADGRDLKEGLAALSEKRPAKFF
jgi:enoyl-CoA hydratase/carnithine racemase